MTNSHNQLNGILTNDKIYFSVTRNDRRRQLYAIPISSIGTVANLLELASQHNLASLWVMPGSNFNHWTKPYAQDLTGTWDIQCSTKPNPVRGAPPVLKGVSGRRRVGTWEQKKQIVIAFPQWNAYEWRLDEVPGAADPITCLAAMSYIEKALNIPLHHNPGIMGRQIIQETNSLHSRPAWIAAPTFNLSDLGNVTAGVDFAFQRGIDPTDLKGKQGYVHSWDKNSMYLAACTSANLGTGDPVYINSEELELHYEETLKRWYDGKRPGMWRIDLHETPYPFNPLYNLDGRTLQEWVTTPLLKLLFAMGARFEVREAYIWPEYHRVLDKFASRIWDARQSLKTDTASYPHAGGRELAYYSMKRIATAGVGLLGNTDAQKWAPAFYRPDWRATVVEEAKARLIYKLMQVNRTYPDVRGGSLPLAVAVDHVFYLSDERDPAAAFPGMFERDEGLGGWKLVHSTPASYQVLSCFTADKTPGQSAKGMKLLVRGESKAS